MRTYYCKNTAVYCVHNGHINDQSHNNSNVLSSELSTIREQNYLQGRASPDSVFHIAILKNEGFENLFDYPPPKDYSYCSHTTSTSIASQPAATIYSLHTSSQCSFFPFLSGLTPEWQ